MLIFKLIVVNHVHYIFYVSHFIFRFSLSSQMSVCDLIDVLLYALSGKTRPWVYSISLASVNIYLRYLASRFHRLCQKLAYKSYPPHLYFVSLSLPGEIYILTSDTRIATMFKEKV